MKIDRVGSYVVHSNVTSKFWVGGKDLQYLSFQFAIFKKFLSMSKRMDKRCYADILSEVS